MTSVLGPYASFWHWRAEDEHYIRDLDPAWARIHQPTAKAIEWVQRNAPNAKIMLRSWDLDDHNGDRKREMYAAPKGAARKHLELWVDKLRELAAEMQRNGWQPDRSRWYVGLVNEPDPAFVPQVVEYTREAMQIAKGFGWRLGVVCSPVGNFSKPSENDRGWTQFMPLEKPINDGGHILIAHEYWQPEGPNYGEDGGNLAWRHRHIPLNVPILIGESGANGYIYGRHSQHDDAGWRKFMSAELYAAQVKEYIEGCDQRVKGVLLYMLDYHSDQWWSFDTQPAMHQLLAIKDAKPQKPSPFDKPHEVHIPIVSTGPQPVPAPSVPTLTHPIADPNLRVISQPFGVNPDRYARFGMAGHNGVDYAVPTGTPIRAVDDGMITEVEEDADGYGKYVKLVHPWGQSLYAHLSRPAVELRVEWAKRGEIIAYSGNTGFSTGPHLHFGLRVAPYTRGWPFDGYTDPLPYLSGATNPTAPTPLVPLIQAAAQEFGIDWQLLASQCWAESSFNPRAVSSAGAMGLMQIMPATWAEWSVKIGAGGDPFDARQNLRVGAAYMRWLLKQTNGNVYLALVAYGWGIGNLLRGESVEPQQWAAYANKVLHGRDLLKATGA